MGLGKWIGDRWNDATGVTANREANRIQQKGVDKSLALQKEMYDTSRRDLQPWTQAGQKYLSQLGAELDSGVYNQDAGEFQNPEFNYTQDPGYQFRLAQGEEASKRQAALSGNLYSGKTLKDLTRFSQGLASEEIGNAYSRFADDRNFRYGNFADSFDRKRTTLADRFSRLTSLSGVGQNSAAGQASAAQGYGQSASSTIEGGANAAAASRIAQYNQRAGAVKNILNLAADAGAAYATGGASLGLKKAAKTGRQALDVGNA